MSTQTQRQSSLRSLSEVTQIVRGAPLGQVDPLQVRQAAVPQPRIEDGRRDHWD